MITRSYQPVKNNNGEKYKCSWCGEYFSHKKVIMCNTLNKSQLLCWHCVDDDWLEIATFINIEV